MVKFIVYAKKDYSSFTFLIPLHLLPIVWFLHDPWYSFSFSHFYILVFSLDFDLFFETKEVKRARIVCIGIVLQHYSKIVLCNFVMRKWVVILYLFQLKITTIILCTQNKNYFMCRKKSTHPAGSHGDNLATRVSSHAVGLAMVSGWKRVIDDDRDLELKTNGSTMETKQRLWWPSKCIKQRAKEQRSPVMVCQCDGMMVREKKRNCRRWEWEEGRENVRILEL